ncbi:MAG: hypothetical protein AAGI91_05360 [Bacteroidota bacterium]
MEPEYFQLESYNHNELRGRFIERHQTGRRSSYTIYIDGDGSSFGVQCFGPLHVLPRERLKNELLGMAMKYAKRWIDSNQVPETDVFKCYLSMRRYDGYVVALDSYEDHPDKPGYVFKVHVSDYKSGKSKFALRGVIAEGHLLGKSERDRQEIMLNIACNEAIKRIDSGEYTTGETHDMGEVSP